ncbi:drebrin-like protein A isoform X2 [Penaeus japonicus]|uniref:drebrin-like protein A isoform X2 n=1 Tax=Penaeus japonicus TaxID=27405 RepID=UPI001C7139D9|nr:drebrin-like protein A isoform X2 [Penaeus japonicus]
MSIDLDTNRNSLLQAFNDVVSDKTSTDWALFGYEGQTNVLKVVGTGEDGLEELAEDLNSSKIMYAVVRVTDPNTTRFKIVLINWQGEGAPTLRKGTCARHLADVHKLLRGVHVTVNARTEEEVEPEFVMAAVLKASATTYNFSDRSEMNDKTTPVKGLVDTFKRGEATGAVGTNYKRTNPLAEIDSKSRNKFWEEQEAEERRRKTEEQQRKDEELKRLENERRQREIVDTKQREILTKERNARIMTERKAEEAAALRCAQKDDPKWQQELENQQREENERAKRAEMMRLERKKEAESLIGHRTHSTRAIFESCSSGSTSQPSPQDRNRPPPRKLKEFKPVNSPAREESEGGTSTPGRGVAARWPPAADSPQQQVTPKQQRVNTMGSVSVSTPVQSIVPAASTPPAPPSKQPPDSSQPQTEVGGSTGYVRNLLREGLPARPDSDEEDQNAEKDEWEEDPPNSQPQQPPQPQQQSPLRNTTTTTITTSPVAFPINHHNNHQSPATNQSPPPPLPSSSPPAPAFHASSAVPSLKQPSAQPSVIPVSQQHHSVPQPQPEYQVPSHHTNGNAKADICDTTIETAKGSYHKNVSEEDDRNFKVHSATTNGAANSNVTYDTTVQSNSSAVASPNAEIPGIGMIYEVDGVEYQILPEHGLCARALYDYQAADDSEITFDPSEIITNIDQIDEGWWQGIGPDGMFGLFPANYVELINQPPV